MTEWNSRDQATETKSGILKNLEVTLIAQWIKGAWNASLPEIMLKSFKKCCISNELDGIEEDVLFF